MAKRKAVDMGGLDAVLPSEGVDLIGNVIRSDRQRSGRGEYRGEGEASDPAVAQLSDYDNMTSPMTSQIVSPSVRPIAGPTTRLKASPPTSMSVRMSADTQAFDEAEPQTGRTTNFAHEQEVDPQPEDLPAQPSIDVKPDRTRDPSEDNARTARTLRHAKSPLAKRIERAREMANSRTMTVTLRLPQELNDWLDEYVHENWREKLKKQQLVIEALRMLVARRGQPGEEVVPTELLGESP